MIFVSYNIQYGKGKDGRFDLDRIAAEIGEADVIALQEVERHWSRSGEADQPAEFAARFPEHHWVFGAPYDVDASYRDAAGKLVNRRRQFGNLLLSRAPILSSRNHLLPKLGLIDQMSLQRSALEGVIETASGPLRVYSVHLGHAAAPERRRQVARLLEILRASPSEGGAWTGTRHPPEWSADGPPPPMPASAIFMGDFNLTPDSAEYEALCGGEDPKYGRLSTRDGLMDCWVAAGNDLAGGITLDEPDAAVRIDYAFATPDIAGKVTAMAVDATAQGSDHQPIRVEIGL
jgi:endonuclease/exonuclease/phosphatase family metal-dependent hydrolase